MANCGSNDSHRRRIGHGRAIGWVVIAGLGTLSGAVTCRTGRQAEIDALARCIPVNMARHLVQDNEREFRAYATTIGHAVLNHAYDELFIAPHSSSESVFVHVESIVAPACRRLASWWRDEYDCLPRSDYYAAYRRRPLGERMRVVQVMFESKQGLGDGTLEEKAERCRQVIAAKEAVDAYDIGFFYAIYAELLPRIQSKDDLHHVLRTGIDRAEGEGNYQIACQMLGQLGVWHALNNDFDAMRVCYDRALAHARCMRSPQEARILSFYASFYRDQGHLALAREYMLRAQVRCRELGGDMEIRYLLSYIEFFKELQCWSLVEKELENADLLLRQAGDPQGPSLFAARIRVLRAQCAVAHGDCGQVATSIEETQEDLSMFPPTSPWCQNLRLESARTLVRCGMFDQAESLLVAGREGCRRFHIPELLPWFEMETASVRLRRHDGPGVEAALRRFRHAVDAVGGVTGILWSRHDIYSVESALLAGNLSKVWERFDQALERAVQRQEHLGSSAEAYLAWTEIDGLRLLGHQLLGGDPNLGYAFEMAWRRMRACGDRAWRPALNGRTPLLRQLRSEARALETALADAGAIHCVYQTVGDRVVRWTAGPGRVERDTLDVSSDELAALVAKARSGLSTLSAPEPLFLAESARLVQVLLPPEVLEATVRPRLLISGDGVLGELPLAALSTSADRFEPLIDRCDVAWLRFHAAPGPDASGSPLIIVEPDYASSLRRRFSVLQQSLPRAAVEATRAAAAFPGAVVLRGSAATKRSLLSRAVEAPILYVASHVVQDPEVPYLSFIPLAAAESERDESYLELSDIRGMNLSRCRLAVLSGCGSGRTYVSTNTTCASIAETLVDAGAQAVVHTYGDVQDDAAEALMDSFLDALQRDGDPVRALAVAQRAAHETGRDLSSWAGYSITLGTLCGSSADGRPSRSPVSGTVGPESR